MSITATIMIHMSIISIMIIMIMTMQEISGAKRMGSRRRRVGEGETQGRRGEGDNLDRDDD